MQKLKELWSLTKRPLFVVLTAILFYEILEHFGIVRSALGGLLRILTPIFAGFALAYVVNIPATLMQKTLFRRAEGKRWAVVVTNVISYMIIAGFVVLIAFLIVPRAAEGVRTLLLNIEGYYDGVVKWATDFIRRLDLSEAAKQRAIEVSQTLAEKVEGFTLEFIPRLLNYTFSTVGILADALLAVAFSVYSLSSKRRMLAHARRFIRAVFSEKNSQRILEVCTYSNDTFRGYIVGQVTSSTIIGILCYIGMRIFGMPYPEMISVFIASFALIPILGPWISTIPSAFIILMASPENPLLALWFIVMIFTIQQIDNNLVYPRVVGNAVGLSSAWVLIAVIVGGGLFGVLGLLLSVPTTAVIYRIVADWTNERARLRGVPIVDTVPDSEYDIGGHQHRLSASRGKNRKRWNLFNKKNEGSRPDDASRGVSHEERRVAEHISESLAPDDKSAEKSADKNANKSAEKSANKSADKSANKSADKSADKNAEKAAKKRTDDTTEG